MLGIIAGFMQHARLTTGKFQFNWLEILRKILINLTLDLNWA